MVGRGPAGVGLRWFGRVGHADGERVAWREAMVRLRLLALFFLVVPTTESFVPVDVEGLVGFLLGDDPGFLVGEADGVEKRVGHVGEGSGAADGDAVLASQLDDRGDEGA